MNNEGFLVHPGNTEPLVIGNKIFKSAYDFNLSEKELAKAQVELGETKEKKKKCLQELKEKLSKVEKLNYRADDAFLLRFLRIRKYNCERAYQNVKEIYQQRKKYDVFSRSHILKRVLDLKICSCLPYTDEEGRILVWVNLDRWNPEETSYEEMMSSVIAVLDIVTLNPKCQINGVIGIWDMSGLSLCHFTEILKNNAVWQVSSLGTKFTSWRIKNIISFNSNPIARMLYTLSRPLLGRKISRRVTLLGSDFEDLHKYVDPAILPKKLGGYLDEEECSVTEHILANLPYLKYDRSFGFE